MAARPAPSWSYRCAPYICKFQRNAPPGARNVWPVRVEKTVFQGDFSQVHLKWGDQLLVARCAAMEPIAAGSEFFMTVEPRRVVLLGIGHLVGNGALNLLTHKLSSSVRFDQLDPISKRVVHVATFAANKRLIFCDGISGLFQPPHHVAKTINDEGRDVLYALERSSSQPRGELEARRIQTSNRRARLAALVWLFRSSRACRDKMLSPRLRGRPASLLKCDRYDELAFDTRPPRATHPKINVSSRMNTLLQLPRSPANGDRPRDIVAKFSGDRTGWLA